MFIVDFFMYVLYYIFRPLLDMTNICVMSEGYAAAQCMSQSQFLKSMRFHFCLIYSPTYGSYGEPEHDRR